MKNPFSKKAFPDTPLAKRMRIMLIIVLCVFGLVFSFDLARNLFMKHFFAHFALPAVTISSSKATLKTWTPTINAVGSVVAINGVEVSPEVAGMVTAIHFNSGQMVTAGQPLIQLDDRTDQQDLKNFTAQLTLTKLNYDRQANLIKTKSTSQSSLDEASAQLQEAQSNVTKTQVLISQKLITAPFSGKIGIRQVNIGQYVSPGTALVSLQSLDPLFVQFTLPQVHFKQLSMNQPIHLEVDNYPGKIFNGKITAIDSTVDVQTRNLLVEATVPNADLQLYPGMFANVEVMLPAQEKVITVPQTAVSFSLYGDSVFTITDDGKDKDGKAIYKVHRRYVTTGERRGNEISIEKGLKDGELIVTSGQLKLEDGVQVYIDNSVQLPGLAPETLKENRT